jgi:hypothetical protein
MYPTARLPLTPSDHLRFLIKTKYGQFWSPFIDKKYEYRGDLWVVAAQPWISHFGFDVDGVMVIDFSNQLLTRPVNMVLPCSIEQGQEVIMKGLVWKSS